MFGRATKCALCAKCACSPPLFEIRRQFLEEIFEHIAAGILLLGETKMVFLRFPAVVVHREHDLIQLLFLELVQIIADACPGSSIG